MTTATDVVNQAIQLISDDQPRVTGVYPTFDSSPAGMAASLLYGPSVATVARQFGWDFSRRYVALAASGNVPHRGWSFEYLYPTMGVEVRQLMPPLLADPNNPLPLNWSVGNADISGIASKVIWSNQSAAIAVFTNQPGPDTWDPLFRESVVRLLASEMAVAVAGKLDSARDLLAQSEGFMQIGVTRDD